MRIAAAAVLVLAALGAGTALADPGVPFRLTTPRGSLSVAAGDLSIGVPGGRAWGVESGLHPLAGSTGVVRVTIAVSDPLVREAFVRIAYYARENGRSRQLAIVDSAAVAAGERATVRVLIDPPPGAVAYRVRVLARLVARDARSAADAIVARSGRLPYTRLRDVGP